MCVIATATATGGGVDIIVAGRVIHVLVPSAPGRVNVQYLSSVHHTGDALKLLLTAIHSHLQSKGKKGKGRQGTSQWHVTFGVILDLEQGLW